MSKSRGNVIDPLEIIEGTSLANLINKVKESTLPKGEQADSIDKLKKQFRDGISECGSDALRFGLLSYMVQSRSINLNIKKIETYRKFCNKIWNSFKFAMGKFEFIKEYNVQLIDPRKESFLNSWILGKLEKAITKINESFEKYALGEAANVFFNFWLYELCDIYLEATKPLFASGSEKEKEHAALSLFICLDSGMRLLHPMMPFITEELYQKLPNFPGKSSTITKSAYPESFENKYEGCTKYFEEVEEKFEIVNKFAGALRSIAASVNLPPQIKADAFISTKEEIIINQQDLLATLGKSAKIHIIEDENKVPKGCGMASIGDSKLFLELGSHIDANKEIERLNKKIAEIAKFKENLDKKINAPNRDRIPEKVRNEQEEQMAKLNTEEAHLLDGIAKIKQLL